MHLKVFFYIRLFFLCRAGKKTRNLNVLVNFLPIFHVVEKKISFFVRHRCVWQPENVYNHLKYITVEYTSLCQPHIFLPFSIITFSSMYLETFFCVLRTMFVDVVYGNEKLGKTVFNNLKIEK